MKAPSKPNGPVILINMFTVEPEKQQALLDQLTKFSETTVKTFPGFISATFHASFDGTRVTNVAQWESREAFLAMIQSPETKADMAVCRGIATNIDYNLYAVTGTFSASAEKEKSIY
jgi:quinol monooxygenase YgiN